MPATDSGNPNSVGMRTIGSAFVVANNNEWKSGTESQNVTQDDDSYLEVVLLCGGRSACSSP